MLRFGVRPLLLATDSAACALALVVAGGGLPDVVFVACLLGLFAAGGLYRSRLHLSLADDLPRLLGRWTVALPLTLALQVVLSQSRWGAVVVEWQFVKVAGLALLAVTALRAVAYWVVRTLRCRGVVAHRTVVVGAGRVGAQVVQALEEHREYGLDVAGYIDSDPLLTSAELAVPVLGSVESLAEVLDEYEVHNVVLAFARMPESEMVQVLRTCDRLRCEVFMVPRLFELHHVSDDMDTVWGIPLVRLRRAPYRTVAWRVKRLVDIGVSSAALVALSPLVALAALAVRLDGGPGVLFRQERVGVDGHRFQVLKFRTMRPADDIESATRWTIAEDDRLTRVGRFLRKTSIDELPQLFNILAGDMSLVGPRPERPHFVQQFHEAYPSYMARHRVPSGLTGWAQVNGLRGDTSIADRARFDNYYIENWSLWLDIKIAFRTVGSILRGAGG